MNKTTRRVTITVTLFEETEGGAKWCMKKMVDVVWDELEYAGYSEDAATVEATVLEVNDG